LKKTIDEKDERIKKLEKSKITKTQIANIQKLKVRNKEACHNSQLSCLFFVEYNHCVAPTSDYCYHNSHRMNEVNSWLRPKNTNSEWTN